MPTLFEYSAWALVTPPDNSSLPLILSAFSKNSSASVKFPRAKCNMPTWFMLSAISSAPELVPM